eukprot:15346957-Ditylum_brightwellii.AAC.1
MELSNSMASEEVETVAETVAMEKESKSENVFLRLFGCQNSFTCGGLSDVATEAEAEAEGGNDLRGLSGEEEDREDIEEREEDEERIGREE